MTLDFVPLEEKHIPLLMQWLQAPHVAEYWQETEDEVLFKEKFLHTLPRRGISAFIVTTGGNPVGFIQCYEAKDVGGGWWPGAQPGVFGIDQFIGEPSLLGKGFGSVMIKAFTDRLFERPEVVEIISDPEPKNPRAIRALEKAGFTPSGEIVTPNGAALLMRLRRKSKTHEL